MSCCWAVKVQGQVTCNKREVRSHAIGEVSYVTSQLMVSCDAFHEDYVVIFGQTIACNLGVKAFSGI